MRLFFSSILLLIALSAFSQQKKFSLSVKTDDEGSVHGFSYWKTLFVSAGDPVYANDEFNSKKNNRTDNLDKGVYDVLIVSHFEQRAEKKVSLKNDTTIFISLKKLNKKTKPKSFSSRLKEGQSLYIIHNAIGMKAEKMLITLKNGKYVAKIFDINRDSLIAERELSAESLALLQKTEKEAAKFNKSSGCSAIETYTFWCNGKYFTVNGGTCSWTAWARLKKAFFGS